MWSKSVAQSTGSIELFVALAVKSCCFFTIQGEFICQADCVVRMVALQTKFELAHILRFCVSGLDHS
jgi:hypothetical protein